VHKELSVFDLGQVEFVLDENASEAGAMPSAPTMARKSSMSQVSCFGSLAE
jgi:hypothetical protein